MTETCPSEQLPAERIVKPGELVIRSRRDGDVHTISLAGELDLATAGDVEQELIRVEATDASVISVDLGEVTFLGSSAIRLLLHADGRSRADSNRLALRPAPDSVMRVLRTCGVVERLPFGA